MGFGDGDRGREEGDCEPGVPAECLAREFFKPSLCIARASSSTPTRGDSGGVGIEFALEGLCGLRPNLLSNESRER